MGPNKPGKKMHSHAYLNEHAEALLDQELQLPVSEEKLNEFRNATTADPEMELIRKMTMDG